MLIEWPADLEAPTKYWFFNLPEEVSLRCLVRLAKLRWRMEQNYQQLKEELGLDHDEGRGRQGWHRHVILVCLAYAFLLLERRWLKKTPLPTFATGAPRSANSADAPVWPRPGLSTEAHLYLVNIVVLATTLLYHGMGREKLCPAACDFPRKIWKSPTSRIRTVYQLGILCPGWPAVSRSANSIRHRT